MTRTRTSILSLMMLTLFAGAPTLAQMQTPPQSTAKPADTTVTKKMDDVSKWTQKQWDAAKAKWSKEKVKWADCQKQANDKKLSGRESWSYLYNCMT